MKLHEFQAKDLLVRYGVPVPKGTVARTAGEARLAAQAFGGHAVVKAQVHAGGRGKAGGVKLVASAEEAAAVAHQLLGSTLVTPQTGPPGAPVHQVLVAETVDVARELYLSILTDGSRRRPVVIASAAGGVEIEEVARTHPDQIVTEVVDPAIGLQPYQARRLAEALGLAGEQARAFGALVDGCYRAYVDKDCSLIEINPLVVTKDGKVVALDAKVTLDDDAIFRHKPEQELRDKSQEEPLELAASEAGIAYVKLDGNVGCMVNGAGLAMATMDAVKAAGAEPANFLDVGGGANEDKIKQAIVLMLSDAHVERVLVNIFGGILRCDVAGRGIVAGYQTAGRQPPLVVRMLGTNVDEGKQILTASGLRITLVDTLHEAAKAIAAA